MEDKKMKNVKLIGILLALIVLISPAFAARQFFSDSSVGTTNNTLNIRSDAGQTVATYINLRTQSTGEALVVRANRKGDGRTGLSSAAAAAATHLDVDGTAQFSIDSDAYILIEDRLNANTCELARVVNIDTTNNILYLSGAITNAFAAGSKVFEMRRVSSFLPLVSGRGDNIYSQTTSIVNAPEGSPLSIRYEDTNTTSSEVSVSGYQGQ